MKARYIGAPAQVRSGGHPLHPGVVYEVDECVVERYGALFETEDIPAHVTAVTLSVSPSETDPRLTARMKRRHEAQAAKPKPKSKPRTRKTKARKARK